MNTEMFKAFKELEYAVEKVEFIKEEINRLNQVTKDLSEKIKEYRKNEDNNGANAISTVVIDIVKIENDNLFKKMNEALEEFKQKAQRFENICFFNGISLQFGLSDKVIKFDK
ncbi:hypothetical protein [Staphylococcus hominis]